MTRTHRRPGLIACFLLLTLLVSACGSPSASANPQATSVPTTQASATTQSTTSTVGSTPAVRATPTRQPGRTPTAHATQSPATPSSAAAQWQLLFEDDFNGTQLNSQWITYNGPHGGGKSYYSPSEIQVKNGQVHLSIEQKTTNGLPYTTGGMGAMRLAQTYGKYEFRAKLPHGKGVGPYAILWDAKGGHGDVEVDLFESPPAMKDKIYFTNHGGGSPSQIIVSNNFADAYHTFTYEWTPGKLHILIDGVDHGTITHNVPNFPMWFGIAVSSGDAFTGLPDASTKLPVSLDVDWVKIYKYRG